MLLKKYFFPVFLFSFCVLGVLAFIYNLKKENPSLNRPVSYNKNQRHPIKGIPEYIENQSSDFSSLHKYLEKQWALEDIEFIKALKQVNKEKIEEIKKPIVAVIDTGIHRGHPCFSGQLWTNTNEIPDNNKDDDDNGFIDDIHGWNFVDNDDDIQDYHGHGSHISGIIAAKGGASCKVIGVSPLVEVMTLKYFDPHSKNASNVENTVKAIEYAVRMGADIINYSGGGPGDNIDEKTAIAKAADKEIIFVAALGNEGSKIGDESSNMGEQNKYYPASYELPNIIAVQSHNEAAQKVESSNYKEIVLPGSRRKQTAPGENILSTLPPQIYLQGKLKVSFTRSLAFSIRDENYGHMTGTSQGTAVTTGVVALAKFVRPNWSMDQIIQLIDQMEKLSAYGSVTMRPVLTNQRDESIDDSQNTITHHIPHKKDKNADTIPSENDITNKNLTHQNQSAIEVMMQINNSIEKDRKK